MSQPNNVAELVQQYCPKLRWIDVESLSGIQSHDSRHVVCALIIGARHTYRPPVSSEAVLRPNGPSDQNRTWPRYRVPCGQVRGDILGRLLESATFGLVVNLAPARGRMHQR